jgi:hypothetical protein
MSARRIRSIGVVVLTAATLTAPTGAQSLADAAKKAAGPPAAPGTPSRSFSDKDLEPPSPAADGVIAPANGDARIEPSGPVLSREEIVKRIMPAVVTIQAGDAAGSGFFVDRGVLMTNRHVVGASNVVRVRFSDGSSAAGQVQRLAADADLALVRVDPGAHEAGIVPLGSYRGLQSGQEVLAIGSSLGVLQNTVTRGIVSAVRRSGGIVFVQTDAAINPGNSGGPLVDTYGRVVGVNTLKVAGAESLGFSIAIDHGRRLIGGTTYVADRAAPEGVRGDESLSALAGPAEADADQKRRSGLDRYDGEVRTASAHADRLDVMWREYTKWCGVRASAPPSGGRAWFAIWSPPVTVANVVDGSCPNMRADLLERANVVKAVMADASERARRQGVFPGDMRDRRRRYSLDYSRW